VQPGVIVDKKQLSAVLEQVNAQQAACSAHQQRRHTARRRPPTFLFFVDTTLVNRSV
jgi:hypothetical protein